MKKFKGHVIRISHESFSSLRQLKGKASYSAAVEALIGAHHTLVEADQWLGGTRFYRVADKIFDDVADARGYALQVAVRNGSQPEWPDIMVCVGQDDGE